jgi:hypothetical protein
VGVFVFEPNSFFFFFQYFLYLALISLSLSLSLSFSRPLYTSMSSLARCVYVCMFFFMFYGFRCLRTTGNRATCTSSTTASS